MRRITPEVRRWGCLSAVAALALCAGLAGGAWWFGREGDQAAVEPPTVEPPTITAVAAIELTRQITGSATATQTPPAELANLAGILGCRPVQSPAEILPHDDNGNPLGLDFRDGANILPPNVVLDRNYDGIFDTRDIVDVYEELACSLARAETGYDSEILAAGDVVSWEKIAATFGVRPDAFGTRPTHLNLYFYGEDARANVADALASADPALGVAIVTDGRNLSETLVTLAGSFVTASGKLSGNGKIAQLSNVMQQLLSPYHLEGVWYPGVDQAKVDEVLDQCLTVRTPVDTIGDAVVVRRAMGEGAVRAEWRDDVEPGGEKLQNGLWRMSNQDGMLVVAQLLNEVERGEAVRIAEAGGHYVTEVNLGGGLWGLVIVFDLRNEAPNTLGVLTAPDAQNIGSFDQLVPCGPGILSLRTPTRAPGVPRLTERPGVTPVTPPVPHATATPRPPIETTTPRPPTATRVTTEAPPETPTTPPVPPTTEVPPATATRVPPTSTERPTVPPLPTDTPRPPTATAALTQPSLPTETPGIPVETPNPHTPTPGMTEPATRLPTPTNPPATETPGVPIFEPFEPWELAAAKKAIKDYEVRRI